MGRWRVGVERESRPSPVVLHGPLEFVNLVYIRDTFSVCGAF
jgi:hypothetical protein